MWPSKIFGAFLQSLPPGFPERVGSEDRRLPVCPVWGERMPDDSILDVHGARLRMPDQKAAILQAKGDFRPRRNRIWEGEPTSPPLIHPARGPPQTQLAMGTGPPEHDEVAQESFPDDLDQSPVFDLTDPEPIPKDAFDQSRRA